VIDTSPIEFPELRLFTPTVYRDTRGEFFELFHESRQAAAGLTWRFVQDNVSKSRRHVLRGLHLQHPNAQGKLVSVLAGAVFDVAVDCRVGSPTFGRWAGFTLSAENYQQLWIPPGFAHGFVAQVDDTLFAYKCTALYASRDELSIRWNDPTIGIRWPVTIPILSDKDAAAPLLSELAPDRLPRWEPTHRAQSVEAT
jgi:dTDP-4-dehydrorhamnose 3,5-epimerase